MLKNSQLNKELWENGYVIIPFLDSNALNSMRASCQRFVPKPTDHFFATTHSPDLELRRQANSTIQEGIHMACLAYLDEAMLLGGAYILKPPFGKGVLSLHQDWNMVDETQHRSYNIWIPLVDTNKENGAIHVLPGSHNKEFTIRGPGIAAYWNNLEEEVYSHMTCLNMRAGEALIYDHALWHSSPPNQSSQPRPAAVIGTVEKDTPLRAWFAQDDQIAEYELSAAYFFNEIDISKPTTLEKLRVFDFQNPILTRDKLNSLYLPNQKKNWWKRMLERV